MVKPVKHGPGLGGQRPAYDPRRRFDLGSFARVPLAERELFCDVLAVLAPEILDSLWDLDDRGLVLAIKEFDGPERPSDRRNKDELYEDLTATVAAWAADQHLYAPWFVDVAVHTKAEDGAPRKVAGAYFLTPTGDGTFRRIERHGFVTGVGRRLCLESWMPGHVAGFDFLNESEAEFRKRIDAHIADRLRHTNHAWLAQVVHSTPPNRRHVEWFVRYQVLHQTQSNIAFDPNNVGAARATGDDAVDEKAVREALIKIAERFEFTLRGRELRTLRSTSANSAPDDPE